MRKLMCKQVRGLSVQDVLDEFNERHQEFGIESEGDIVSVSAMPPTTTSVRLATPTGTVDPKVEVVIVYWETKD